MVYTPVILGSGVAGYRFLENSLERQRDLFANASSVAGDLSYLKDRIESIETVDQLMDDRRLLGVVLGAFGLQDDIDNRGFIRKVLESDLANPRSFANRLGDKRYQSLATTLNFSGNARLLGANETDTLRDALGRFDDVDDLLDNEVLLQRALDNYELEADVDQTAFLRSVLLSDVSDPNSLVNRLENKGYLEFAKAFQGVAEKADSALVRSLDEEARTKLDAVKTAEDIVTDRDLLRSVLTHFGLEDQINNTFLLQAVLESDLSDPESFALQQRDTRFVELAQVFDFVGKSNQAKTIDSFVETFSGKLNSFSTAEELWADQDAVTALVSVFGLEEDTFIQNEENFLAVMNSQTFDEYSFVNSLEDGRYVAMVKLFEFADIAGGEPIEDAQVRLNDVVEAISEAPNRARTPQGVLDDIGFSLEIQRFFDLPFGTEAADRFRRITLSDPDDQNSALAVSNDPRYQAYFNAMDFNLEEAPREYPAGFADSIAQAYVENQFEIAVGNVDNTMRLALSLEGGLQDVVTQSRATDAQWFSIMGAPPLRSIFEAVFNLPSGFGAIDIEQQLVVLKERSERFFGTERPEDLLNSDILDQIRDRYLMVSAGSAQTSSSSPQTASLLLSNATSGSLFG